METETYCYRYPHPAVTTDCVVFAFDGQRLKVLLVERGGQPYKGMWAFPGGFLNIDEAADVGARRELMEETGLRASHIEQLHTFSAPDRDPRERVVSIAYLALVRLQDVHGADDAADARWFDVDALPLLAFDHAHVVATALARLRELLHLRPVIFELMPERFTLRQLRLLCEEVLGSKLDSRNFSRRMLRSGLLMAVDGQAEQGVNRAQRWFALNRECYDRLTRSGFSILP